MIRKRAFRFLLVVETTIKMEEVKTTDKEKKRYLKELVNAFDEDPKALFSIILTNFIDLYCGDYREELELILGNQENDRATILRVAKKCTPEAFQYFSDLFADCPVKKPDPGNEREESLSSDDPGKGQDPGTEVNEIELVKNLESEWVLGELIRRLCKFAPVHAAFSELPLGKRTPFTKRIKRRTDLYKEVKNLTGTAGTTGIQKNSNL